MRYTQMSKVDDPFEEEFANLQAEMEAKNARQECQQAGRKSEEWNCRFHFPKTTLTKVKLIAFRNDITIQKVVQNAIDFYFESNEKDLMDFINSLREIK